jgi:phosphoribosylformimino-5-aminoimidazole carboxamide ribotide isomerase
MRIIPVIDLLDGKVVHAVAGDREKYGPIKSVLTKSSDPLSVAKAFRDLGFEEIYTADLNAIRSKGRNLDSIGEMISRSRVKMMIDGGFKRACEAKPYVEKNVSKIILATETLESFEEIEKARNDYGLPVIGSIDMKGGLVITRSQKIRLPLTDLINRFEGGGASEIIILDMDRIGTSQGPNFELLEKVLNITSVPVLAAGGIRDITDIYRLRELGIDGALLATALHKGRITKEDLDRL